MDEMHTIPPSGSQTTKTKGGSMRKWVAKARSSSNLAKKHILCPEKQIPLAPSPIKFVPVVRAENENRCLFMVRETLRSNYLAPVKSTLSKPGAQVLDIGCGTGAWIADMSTEFPQARFFGISILDQYSTESFKHPNVHLVVRDALDGLPFEDESLDYVVQRFMYMTWTREQWTYMVGEMVRVVKPGGYIEMWEIDGEPHSLQPQPGNVFIEVLKYLETNGFDPYVARRLPAFLASHSLKKIRSSFFSLPFKWAGERGELNESIFKQHMLSVNPRPLDMDQHEYGNQVELTIDLFNSTKSYVNVHIAWAEKAQRT